MDIIMPPAQRMVSNFLARIAGKFANGSTTKIETWLPPEQQLTSCLLDCGMVPGKEPFGIIPTVKILHPD